MSHYIIQDHCLTTSIRPSHNRELPSSPSNPTNDIKFTPNPGSSGRIDTNNIVVYAEQVQNNNKFATDLCGQHHKMKSQQQYNKNHECLAKLIESMVPQLSMMESSHMTNYLTTQPTLTTTPPSSPIMSKLLDCKMMEKGTLLSILWNKCLLDMDEETIDLTTDDTNSIPSHSQAMQLDVDHASITTQMKGTDIPQGRPHIRASPYLRSILYYYSKLTQPPVQLPMKDPYQLPFKNLVKILMVLTCKDAATKCHQIITHLFTHLLNVDDSVQWNLSAHEILSGY